MENITGSEAFLPTRNTKSLCQEKDAFLNACFKCPPPPISLKIDYRSSNSCDFFFLWISASGLIHFRTESNSRSFTGFFLHLTSTLRNSKLRRLTFLPEAPFIFLQNILEYSNSHFLKTLHSINFDPIDLTPFLVNIPLPSSASWRWLIWFCFCLASWETSGLSVSACG